MALDRPPLTARQLAVLRWIADGCPDGVWPDHSHKLSVRRLETLNVASVRRWYGKWNAVIQPDGEYYLQHGTYPASPTNAPRPSAKPARADTPRTEPSSVPSSDGRRTPPAKDPSPTEQLIGRIIAAGGTLSLTPDGDAEHRTLEAQVHAAQRHRKTPPGTQLLIERPRWETFILKIVALPDWMARPPTEIPVPTQLRRPHGAIAALRDSEHRLPITGAPRRRALLLLQALVTAVIKRGHTVAGGHRQDRYGRPQPQVHLSFTVAGYEIGLRITQLNSRTDHVPTAKELAHKQRYGYSSIPRYDYTPSDRLKLELTSYASGSWKDGVRRKLEDCLPEVLQAIERGADAAERARLAAEERKRQQELERQRQIAQATQRLIQANRAKVLDEQVIAWFRSRQLDEYLDALTATVEAIEDPEDGVAAAEWLAWARHRAKTVNPLNGKITMPTDPKPTPTNLQPYIERPHLGW